MERAAAAEKIPTHNWRGVQAKMRALDTIRREAERYERLAERFNVGGSSRL
jgi:hypothetical protein